MPVVFRWKNFTFFFFSNEGDPREPSHIHVRSGGARAKFWLRPVELAENIGFAAHELNSLLAVIEENQALIERVWHEHFGI
ncbi:MAG: hypothetical protein AUK51_04690 [Comamonadaceae bacterium CG2_30_59_20]|nr:MAG: hypothetical protein AUK51_04690 [Comamonadaceae bacterium CG2_30_59_20]